MKKNLLLISAISLFSLFSCNRDSNTVSENQNLKPIEAIVKDSRFINFETNEANAVLNIKDIKTVKELSSKGYLNSAELLKLSQALGFSNSEDYLNFYRHQSNLLKELNYDYNLTQKHNLGKVQSLLITENIIKFDKIKLSAAGKNYIASTSGPIEESDDSTDVSPDSCKRTYRNCMGAAASAAIIGHVACAATDLTVIAGAVCHSAVLAAQYFAQDECGNQYANCK